MLRQRIADTVRAATEWSVPRAWGAAEMWSLDCKRRLRMRPLPPTAATMRARRRMDTMTCTELPATAMGPPHELQRRCLWPIRQEPFCLATAVEECETKYIFECRENIVANGPHKRADQSQTKRTAGWQKFRSRQSSQVISCSKLPMFQQEAELSRMSRLAKVSPRENSSVFWHQTA